MKSKKINFRIVLFAFSIAFFSFACKKSTTEDLVGDWSKLSTLDGIPRSDAAGFMIGSKGYLGGGYDGNDRLSDFWEYNIDQNNWSQLADVPGAARNGAVGFGTDSKGYIGTGFDGNNALGDFYEYIPSSNTWVQIDDFPGDPRYGAVAFSINNKGYVGTGVDDLSYKDFYEYDTSSASWTKINSITGNHRRDATSFVINGKGYVVTGIDNGVYDNEVYAYDPATGIWEKRKEITNKNSDESYDDDYTSITRVNGVGFTVNGKGYLAGGSSVSLVNNVWEYDPVSDLWTEKTALEGATRTEAIGWGYGSYGYVTTGRSSSYYLYDIWKFDPSAEYDENN